MRVKHLIEELQRRNPEAELSVEITSATVREFRRLNSGSHGLPDEDCYGYIAAIEPCWAGEFELKIVLMPLV